MDTGRRLFIKSSQLETKQMGPYLTRPSILSLVEGLMNEEELKRRGNRRRDRGYAQVEVDELSDSNFITMFRMNRENFERLLRLISPILHESDEAMAMLSSGSTITKRTKLYATLRWLAGGSYLDICFAWGISYTSFFTTDPAKGVVWPVVEAIDVAFTIGLPAHDVESLETMATAL